MFNDEEEVISEEIEEVADLQEEEIVAEEPERDLENDAKFAAARRKAEEKLRQQEEENRLLRARLKSLEEKENNNVELSSLIQSYIGEGWDEAAAKRLANQDLKIKRMEDLQIRSSFERQAEKLESKYPDIMDNLDKLIAICDKTGWPLEKVCKAELSESETDTKINNGMETLVKNKATQLSKPPVVTATKPETLKFSAEDEAAYQYYTKRNPGISRKQYDEKILKPRRERNN